MTLYLVPLSRRNDALPRGVIADGSCRAGSILTLSRSMVATSSPKKKSIVRIEITRQSAPLTRPRILEPVSEDPEPQFSVCCTQGGPVCWFGTSFRLRSTLANRKPGPIDQLDPWKRVADEDSYTCCRRACSLLLGEPGNSTRGRRHSPPQRCPISSLSTPMTWVMATSAALAPKVFARRISIGWPGRKCGSPTFTLPRPSARLRGRHC